MNSLPNFSVDLPADPGTPEGDFAEKDRAAGLVPFKPEFITYKVKVHKVVTGEDVEKDTFLFYNADFAGVEPELKPGMKIIAVVKGDDRRTAGRIFVHSLRHILYCR